MSRVRFVAIWVLASIAITLLAGLALYDYDPYFMTAVDLLTAPHQQSGIIGMWDESMSRIPKSLALYGAVLAERGAKHQPLFQNLYDPYRSHYEGMTNGTCQVASQELGWVCKTWAGKVLFVGEMH